MKQFRTAARTRGIAIGKAFLPEPPESAPCHRSCSFSEALSLAREDLSELAQRSDIFAAHLEMLDDPMLSDTVSELLSEGMDDVTACESARDRICEMFSEINDEYLRARTDDVRDVFSRIIRHIRGESGASPFASIPDGAVIVARQLNPSDTAVMDLDKVSGFVTETGSSTSHVCIIASAHGIAAAVGVEGCMSIRSGATVIVDGPAGIVIEDPEEAVLEEYRKKCRAAAESASEPISEAAAAMVYANAGSLSDVRAAMEEGAAGIGLFRTEFLYMDGNSFPDDETQFRVYRDAALLCGDKPLTIRTLDIGADKSLPYCPFPHEDNPALGLRAIRFCLSRTDIFKVQLRAILRASCFGNVRLMLPMICSLGEIRSAQRLISECRAQLLSEGVEVPANVPVGIMVETPAAVFEADILAENVDFFSVGSNDLTQYIMAADRGNIACAKYCEGRSRAVLRAIGMAVEAAHRRGIECCICGEMAADPDMTGELFSLGLDRLSVSPPSVKTVGRRLSKIL